MGDAEIIPIGTRGRPGRGTGTRPSAAARNLAPRSRTGAPKSGGAGDEAPDRVETGRAAETDTAAPPTAERAPSEPIIPLLGDDAVPLPAADTTPT